MSIGMFVISILAIIDGSLGTDLHSLLMSQLDSQIARTHHGTSSSCEDQHERMKAEFDEEPLIYDVRCMERLPEHVNLLIEQTRRDRAQNVAVKPEEVEQKLPGIYSAIAKAETNHENLMLEELVKKYPEYQKVPSNLLQSIIEKWYKQKVKVKRIHTDNWKASRVRWTGQMKADIMYILSQVRTGRGYVYQRIHERWEKMHPDLGYMKAQYLAKVAYNLRFDKYKPKPEEEREAMRRYNSAINQNEVEDEVVKEEIANKKLKWTMQKNADILHIYHANNKKRGKISESVKECWDKMYPNLNFVNKSSLLAHVYRLQSLKYEPNRKEKEQARIKYEGLSPPKEY